MASMRYDKTHKLLPNQPSNQVLLVQSLTQTYAIVPGPILAHWIQHIYHLPLVFRDELRHAPFRSLCSCYQHRYSIRDQ